MSEQDTTLEPGARRAAAGWPGVGAALLVGALAGAAWFAVQMPRPAPPVVAQAAPAPEPVASAPAGDIATLMRVEEPAEPPEPSLPAGHVLVCGQAVEAEALADDRLDATLREAGVAQALARFAQERLADDEHARAVGLALRMRADASQAAPRVAELAALAHASRDARVWTLARDLCSTLDASQAPTAAQCQQLGARRLVELERDNAVAWLALAAEEPAAVDEALYQASIATRWDDHAMAARRFVERVDAKGGLASLVLLQGLLQTPPLRSIAAQQVLLRECAAERVRADVNRAQLCTRVAERLHEGATSVGALVTAAALGESLAHPQAAAWRDRARLFHAALNAAATDVSARERAAVECSLGLPRELLARSAREGEVAALRAWLDTSGLADEQWLARAEADEAVKVAAASAPAASAAR